MGTEQQTCATCGGDLPEFPAYIVTGEVVTGPFCDAHAVLLTEQHGSGSALPEWLNRDIKRVEGELSDLLPEGYTAKFDASDKRRSLVMSTDR